ncbi:malonyl-CoA decarboxylase family protein [Alphaproteobacteria bacterium]|nr:malonyl-CoA decarboxylase family protein [Alphaproteobacteria bacterium]
MNFFADILSSLFDRKLGLANRVEDDNKPIDDLCQALLSSRGDVSGMSLAQLILDRYADLDDDDKLAWFLLLANDMDVPAEVAIAAIKAYQDAPSAKNYEAMTAAVEPARLQLIRRLNQTHDATAKLVAMREDLIRFLPEHSDLGKLNVDFKLLFASWFNRGFLVLRPINWSSPAHILEKIITYESVHEIENWDDLRRRLQPDDRRCFAFFHPAMPDEPLIFVEVALTKGTPNSIQSVLLENRDAMAAAKADTAAFYSISNCQAGLSGISFGNSLIKTVVQHLLRELPQIRNFVTLSPIPGLVKWLRETGNFDADATAETHMQLAAHYLLNAKHHRGQPHDPVARFHLNNGALVGAVHANADKSKNGMAQSCGVMVNYRYDLSRISENHEAFANQQTVIAEKSVKALAAEIEITDRAI